MPLSPGDTFVAFSGGVSEAMDARDGFFGEERLLVHLSASPAAAQADIVRSTLDADRAFAAGAPQSDDITILAAKHR